MTWEDSLLMKTLNAMSPDELIDSLLRCRMDNGERAAFVGKYLTNMEIRTLVVIKG